MKKDLPDSTDISRSELTRSQMAERMQDIGLNLQEMIMNNDIEKSIYYSDASTKLFGTFSTHPSLFRSDSGKRRALQKEIPSFSLLAGNLHALYRTYIPQSLPQLNEKKMRLDPAFDEVMAVIDQFRELMSYYVAHIENTRRHPNTKFDEDDKPDYFGISEATRNYIAKECDIIITEFKAANAKGTALPIIANDVEVDVQNTNEKGVSLHMALFTLELITRALTDTNKMPREMRKFFEKIVGQGAGSSIIRLLDARLNKEPLLSMKEEAYARYYPALIEQVALHQHALQMALLADEKPGTEFSNFCTKLLSMTNCNLMPQHLESPLECAAIADRMLRYDKMSSLYEECIKMYEDPNRKMDVRVRIAAEDVLNEKALIVSAVVQQLHARGETSPFIEEILLKRIELVREFLQRQRVQLAGRVT